MRKTVGDNPKVAPTSSAQAVWDGLPLGSSPFQYSYSQSDTNTPYILFVHGWNLQPWLKDRFAETAYKRLYWQGYQSRFGSFRWPTDYNFGQFWESWENPATNPRNFDDSEFNAWRSAPALKLLLAQLNTNYPGQVRVCAHSLGNIVVGEALRQATNGPVVAVYAAVQAALPSHSWDPNATNRSISFGHDSGTPNAYAHYWTSTNSCYFNGVTGASAYVNFYNPVDYALTGKWELGQDFKPDGSDGYRYSGGTFYHDVPINATIIALPTNTYEIFAYCDEARCRALGAQANVGGAFTISAQLDLDALYNFGSLHKGHSGEFRSTIINRGPFWDEMLKTMLLKPRP